MDYNILKQDQVNLDAKKELVDILTQLKQYTLNKKVIPFSVLNYESIQKTIDWQVEE